MPLGDAVTTITGILQLAINEALFLPCVWVYSGRRFFNPILTLKTSSSLISQPSDDDDELCSASSMIIIGIILFGSRKDLDDLGRLPSLLQSLMCVCQYRVVVIRARSSDTPSCVKQSPCTLPNKYS